jgi:hypothetical protein
MSEKLVCYVSVNENNALGLDRTSEYEVNDDTFHEMVEVAMQDAWSYVTEVVMNNRPEVYSVSTILEAELAEGALHNSHFQRLWETDLKIHV